MSNSDADGELLRLRGLARRARRLAENLSDDDRRRLVAHADELDLAADELERRGAERPASSPKDPPGES
jgi:hypothetical protein